MNELLPSIIIIKKILEHPALIFAFIRFNKSISSFKKYYSRPMLVSRFEV